MPYARKRPVVVSYEIADKPGVIDTKEGPMSYVVGDYLMCDYQNDGRRWPVDPRYFALHCDVVSDPQITDD